MQAEQRLEKGLQQLELEVSVEIQQKLMDYLQLMLKWNKAYNLTAIRDLDAMVIRHVLDSLSILPWSRLARYSTGPLPARLSVCFAGQ